MTGRTALEIRLDSPTLIAAGPPSSNLVDTLTFIPGNTLRGVLAWRYIDEGGDASSPEFKRLFLGDKLSFGFAFKDGAQAIPLSARTCKYYGGFRADGGHGVMDLLASNGELRCEYEDTPCSKPLDYCNGFYDPMRFREVGVTRRLVTRTAISRARGSADHGRLYTQRVMEEGQRFVGRIYGDEDLVAKIRKLVGDGFEVRIGKGVSRGMGWARVSMAGEAAWAWPPAGAKERFEAFKEKFGRPVLAVTLLCDALFTDDYLRDRTSLTIKDLEPLGIKVSDWKEAPANVFAATRRVFGFDGEPIGLPRTPKTALAAGSVFLFEAEKGVDNPCIPDGDGVGFIGEGRLEGYGRAMLWHPFHVEAEREDVAEGLPGRDLDSILAERAGDLYALGFGPSRISSSQMAALAERIRRAKDLEEAEENICSFIDNQLGKLRKGAERTGKKGSWLLEGRRRRESLGDLFKDYVVKEKRYRRGLCAGGAEGLDLLRRFWRKFHNRYRIEASFKEPVPMDCCKEEE
ncbi:MAG TPA: hypothetical protein ENJ37_00200 [Deltaproteobacteria bacterium]|nr:hypothetical protein [Deltaproteobacteria bacterium]